MRRLPSGSHVHEIRRKTLGRWSFALSANAREARTQRACLNALADARERDILTRIANRELALEDAVAALAPGGAGLDALRRSSAVTLGRACAALLTELRASPRNTQRSAGVVVSQLLAAFGASRAIASIEYDEVLEWLRRPTWNARTQAQKRSYAARVWEIARMLGERSLANHWLAIRVARPRAVEEIALNLHETHALLDALEARGRVRDAAFLACGFLGTLRIGEVCALRWNDVGKSELVVAARAEWTPKTQASARTVFIPTRLRALLEAWRTRAPRGAFVFGGTRALPERTGHRWARSALDVVGESHLTFHVGRHSAITNALTAGIPVHEVVAQAGASAKTLLSTYAHALTERRPRIASVYDRPEIRPEPHAHDSER